MNEEVRKMLEECRNHGMYETFTEDRIREGGDPLPFSCRGCGYICCRDTNILITPPEAARIIWYLKRNGLENKQQWGITMPGGATGLPILMMKCREVEDSKEAHYCPFLCKVVVQGKDGKVQDAPLAFCAIYPVRPTVCRIYPVGRIKSASTEGTGAMQTVGYVLSTTDCPGFHEKKEEGEIATPDYVPLGETNQTVEDYVRQKTDSLVDEEVEFYMQKVIPAWMQAGLHLPTEDHPEGFGGGYEDVLFGVATRMLYNPPTAPEDPAHDHDVLMEWLTELVDAVKPFQELIKDVDDLLSTAKSMDAGAVGQENPTFSAELAKRALDLIKKFIRKIGPVIRSGMRPDGLENYPIPSNPHLN